MSDIRKRICRWSRVNRRNPCLICFRPNWCGFAIDETTGEIIVHCERVADAPGWRKLTPRRKSTGSFFIADAANLPQAPEFKPSPNVKLPIDYFCRLVRKLHGQLSREREQWLTDYLGVSAAALGRFRVGWIEKCDHVAHAEFALSMGAADAEQVEGIKRCAEACYAIPMLNECREAVGISTRSADSRNLKLSLVGGRWGVFYPDELDLQGKVILPEGASNTMALTDAGHPAIGRPSRVGGETIIAAMVKNHDVFVMADFDQKPDGAFPGKSGAIETCAKLAKLLGRTVKWGFAPDGAKDFRAYWNHQNRVGGAVA